MPSLQFNSNIPVEDSLSSSNVNYAFHAFILTCFIAIVVLIKTRHRWYDRIPTSYHSIPYPLQRRFSLFNTASPTYTVLQTTSGASLPLESSVSYTDLSTLEELIELPITTPSSPSPEAAQSTFQYDVTNGLTSATFNLVENNLMENDTRPGLDDTAKRSIARIMRHRSCSFDSARHLYLQIKLKNQGIRLDGQPNDPKFVSFS